MHGQWGAVGLTVAVVACGHDGTRVGVLDTGRVGASIALLTDGSVAVVNPDQGSVSVLDPGTLEPRVTVDVGGEPHALLPLATGVVLVTNYRGGEVVALDPTAGAVVNRHAMCAGPWGIAESPDRAWVAVACEWDGTVQRVDPVSLSAQPIAQGLRRPRALAVGDADLYVADYVGGLVHDISLPAGSDDATSLVPSSAPERPALTKMSANLASAMVPAFGSLYVAHALENNTGDTSEPVADDYGTVMDTNPKINPAVTPLGGGDPVTYAVYDGGNRVYSGPSAIASFGGAYLLVAHVSTANVAVLDTSATSSEARAVGTLRVGFGPSGIAVDEANQVAYVDNAFDGSVSRISLAQSWGSPTPRYDADLTRVRQLPARYSASALAGRKLFFDASNPHVTPAGVVACTSCHPGGTDDGLVWFEHTANIPLKRRRTPHLANAKTPTAPFHWDGAFPTMSALVHDTMTNVMGGDGLLVDVSTVQAFIDEIVLPPVLPPADPAAVARGQALFDSPVVLCSSCHSGPYTTDDLIHSVLSPMSLSADDAIAAANTPGLHGVFLLAPYFHDGRATDLHDVLTRPDAAGMGHTQGLTEAQLQDLIAYLRSL
jgi:DNA-binding beta-propeller fold protein YncE